MSDQIKESEEKILKLLEDSEKIKKQTQEQTQSLRERAERVTHESNEFGNWKVMMRLPSLLLKKRGWRNKEVHCQGFLLFIFFQFKDWLFCLYLGFSVWPFSTAEHGVPTQTWTSVTFLSPWSSNRVSSFSFSATNSVCQPPYFNLIRWGSQT